MKHIVMWKIKDENKLENSKKIKPMSKKRLEYYSSKEFYDSHPDLMPSDVYIYEGRLIRQKEWDKSIRKFERRVDFEIRMEKMKEFVKGITEKVKNFFRRSDKK